MAHILLVGNMRVSLPLARNLSRAGHTIHCDVDALDPFLFKSRHIRGHFTHGHEDDDLETVAGRALRYLSDHPEIDTLIPVSETSTRFYSANRGHLPPGVRLILPSADVVDMCTRKSAMFDLCDGLGVAVASRRIVSDYPTLLDAVEAIGRPCVVKPVDASSSIFGRKALVVSSGERIDRLVPHWPEGHLDLCVQAFVQGARHNVVFAAHEGSLVGAVEFESLRTDRADGTGYSTHVVSVAPDPAVVHATQALVGALNYTGVGMLQFMVDRSSGEVSLLELNPRLGGTYRAAEICGLPVSVLMLDLGRGCVPALRPDPWAYRVGVRLVWTRGDISGLLHEMKCGRLGAWPALRWAAAALRDAFRRHHMTLDAADPSPTVQAYLHPLLRRLGLERDRRAQAPILSGPTRMTTAGFRSHREASGAGLAGPVTRLPWTWL